VTGAPVQDPQKTIEQDAASPADAGGAAPVSAPEAAREEVAEKPKAKTVDFRGLTLELPDTLPGTVALDYAEIEDGKKAVSPVVNLIKSIIGEEQYNLLYAKVAEDGITMDEVIDGLRSLFDDLFAAYGTSAGESEASAGSS
jgi:hypothetical protein